MQDEKVSDRFPGGTAAAGEPALHEKEIELLRVLVERQGRVVTRQELARRAGLRDMQPRRVDVLLVGVRRFVGPENLVNVRSRGWMLVDLPPAVAALLATGSDPLVPAS